MRCYTQTHHPTLNLCMQDTPPHKTMVILIIKEEEIKNGQVGQRVLNPQDLLVRILQIEERGYLVLYDGLKKD